MISIKAESSAHTVIAVEKEVGNWVCMPEQFADFFDQTPVPSQFSTLGGTLLVSADWRSSDPFTRFYCAQWVIEQYFDSLVAIPQPVTMDVLGLPEASETQDEAELVF